MLTLEKVSKLILLISLAFAAISVFLSLLFSDSDNLEAITIIFLAIWFVLFGYLQRVKKKSPAAPPDGKKKQ